MPAFLRDNEATLHSHETNSELAAWHDVLTQLVAFSKNELGIRQTEALTSQALMKTGFQHLRIDHEGFLLETEAQKQQFELYENLEKKKSDYFTATSQLYQLLLNHLPQQVVQEQLAKITAQAATTHTVPVPFSSLIEGARVPAVKSKTAIANIISFNHITGVALILHLAALTILLIANGQSLPILPIIIPLFVLFLLYIYLRYLSLFSYLLNGLSITSFVLPILLLGIMAMVPKYALLLLFMYFPLATPIAFLYSRRRLLYISFIVASCLFVYFLLFNSMYSTIENVIIAIWLSTSFLLYAWRDTSIAKQVKTQMLEQKGLELLTTKLEQTEAELVAEKKKLTTQSNQLTLILAAVAEAVIAVDSNYKVILVNAKAQSLLGMTETNMIGKPISLVLQVTQEGKAVANDMLFPSAEGYENKVLYQGKGLSLNTASQNQIFVDITVTSIAGSMPTGVKAIITLHDVTKEKQIEAMHLDLISITAHELKAPLTSLRGYLTLFDQDLKHKLSKDQLLFLDRMGILANQLLSLIENLLAVNKIEHNALTLMLEPVSYSDLVKKAVEGLKSSAANKQITITIADTKENLPPITLDQLRISEVLYNLITNAIKFSPKDGHIEIRTYQDDTFLVTEIKDNGIGIPKAELPKLFTKFFQVSSGDGQSNKGTGLGLYIAKEIVSAHGGVIWVDSEEGRGSIFSFKIPYGLSTSQPHMATPTLEQQKKANELASSGKKRVFQSGGTPLLN